MTKERLVRNIGVTDAITIKRLAKLPCFAVLSPAIFNEILSHATLASCKNHETIWHCGDPGDYFVAIVDGTIAINRTNEQGDENMVGIFGPGDVIGLSAVLRGAHYPATARSCATGTEIVKLYSAGIRPGAAATAGASNPYQQILDQWLRDLMLAHERILQDKIEITSAGSIRERTYLLLKSLTLRFGQEIEGVDGTLIPLALTKTLIAKLVGARVETVIRLLRSWERDKYIKMTRCGTYVQNLENLKDS